jgi:hypothetical protein
MAAGASSGSKIEVSIKWGKKKLDAVAVDLGASSDEFRNTIQTLTGEPLRYLQPRLHTFRIGRLSINANGQ